MRKYLILLVALAMVLGLSEMAMAALDTRTIAVTASVPKYAVITNNTGLALSFSGSADQTVSGTVTIGVETNTNVTIGVSTTNLSQTIGTPPVIYTIPTTVTIDTVTGSVTQAYSLNAGAVSRAVKVSGTTGAISAQPAGEYSTTVTITVSVPTP